MDLDLIIWSSKKQSTVETSVVEAEFLIVKHVYQSIEADLCMGRDTSILVYTHTSINR